MPVGYVKLTSKDCCGMSGRKVKYEKTPGFRINLIKQSERTKGGKISPPFVFYRISNVLLLHFILLHNRHSVIENLDTRFGSGDRAGETFACQTGVMETV